MAGFIETSYSNGTDKPRRMMLNMDQLFAFLEGADGHAIAVSMTGHQQQLGETYASIAAEMSPEPERKR